MAYVQAIVAIATAVASAGTGIAKGVLSKRENERAREEAKRLAELQRQDELKYQSQVNDLTKKGLDMNQSKIDFGRSMLNSDMREKEKQREYDINKMNQDVLEQTSDKNLDPLKLNRRRFI